MNSSWALKANFARIIGRDTDGDDNALKARFTTLASRFNDHVVIVR